MILRLISIYCSRVRHWLGNAFLWPFSEPIHWRSHLKKQSRDPDVVGEFKMAPAKRVKRCDMSTSQFTTMDAFFENVNESSDPAIVPEQSESFVTVLSPTAGILQWPSAIVVDFDIESDSGSDSLT